MSRSDEKYDAWGQDRRISPEEAAYWEEMTPGADENHNRPGMFDAVCTACGRDLAAQECCVACGDPE